MPTGLVFSGLWPHVGQATKWLIPTLIASLLLGRVFVQPHAGQEKTVGAKAMGMVASLFRGRRGGGCTLLQPLRIGAERGGGDHASGERDGEGGQVFQGGCVVVHVRFLSGGGLQWVFWVSGGGAQIAPELLLQLGLQSGRADDSGVGQPVAHGGQNLVGVRNEA